MICVYVVVETESSSAFYAMESDSCFCEHTYYVYKEPQISKGGKRREGKEREERKKGGKMIEGEKARGGKGKGDRTEKGRI